MRKPIVMIAACSALVLVALLIAWRAAWLPGAEEAPGQRPAAGGRTAADAELRAEAVRRAELLAGMDRSELDSRLGEWAGQTGRSRRVSWMAAAEAVGRHRDRVSRTRGCRLALVLAGSRPRGAAAAAAEIFPGAVEPLAECVGSSDPALISAAVAALGTMHLNRPELGIRQRTLPAIRAQLRSADPEALKAAMGAVPLFKEFRLVPELIAGWKRLAADEAVARAALGHLRVLLELKLREEIEGSEPELDARAVLTRSRRGTAETSAKLGTDPEKWRAWWAARMPGLAKESGGD
jgi:hypothetical protein